MANLTSNIKLGSELQTLQPSLKKGAATGKWRGQTLVQKPSTASAIQNALEEITELGAEKSEDEKLKKDEFHDLAKDSVRSRVEDIEELVARLDDAENARKVEQFLSQKARLRNPAQLLDEAQREFSDPSWQFVALTALEHSTEGDQRVNAASARQQLLAKHNARIWGGINITPQAQQLTKEPARLSGLRDFYTQTTAGYEGILESYDKIIAQFGESQITKGVGFLLQAAAADLAAANTSIPKEKLRSVLGELYSLEVIATMHTNCQTMLNRLANIAPLSITAAKMMRSILVLAKRDWLEAQDITHSTERMGATTPFEKINVLREVRHVVARLPLKVTSPNPEARQRFLAAVQAALDQAITTEEAEQ